MMNIRTHVLVDIDHTISNAFPRDPMIGNGTWDEYHAASSADEPLHDVVQLINAMWGDGFKIIGLTARPEKWRQLTMLWMVNHNVHMDEILMRPDDAFHPAPEIKLALVNARFSDPRNQIAMLLEDREDVCAAFKELGITVLQVHGRCKE